MKIQIATDFVLQTYNPGNNDVSFGYSIVKSPMDDSLEYTVECNTGNIFAINEAQNNAHILAWYIKYNELKHLEMINK